MSSTAETEFQRLGLHPALGYKNSHDAGRCFLRPLSELRYLWRSAFFLPAKHIWQIISPSFAKQGTDTKEENLFVEEDEVDEVDEARCVIEKGWLMQILEENSGKFCWRIYYNFEENVAILFL